MRKPPERKAPRLPYLPKTPVKKPRSPSVAKPKRQKAAALEDIIPPATDDDDSDVAAASLGMPQARHRASPWMPADYDRHIQASIKACVSGVASPQQQQRAIEWIVRSACRTYDETYHPTSERDSAYAQGKRAVGLQLVKLINMPTIQA